MSLSTGSVLAGGISTSGTVGAASATLIPAGTYSAWVTIKNTHATQTLSLSFNAAAVAADFPLAAGASVTLPFGLANSLQGIGSGAGTTWAAIGF